MRCFTGVVSFGVVILGALMCALAGAQESGINGHREFPGLLPAYEEKFFESVFQGSVLTLAPGIRSEVTERDYVEAWEGNKPNLVAQLPRVILRFHRPRAEKSSQEGEHFTFDISVDFFRDSIVVKTSHPASAKQSSGYRFPLGATEQWKAYIPGEEDTGMAVLMPQVALQGQYVRGLMVCPRKLFRLKQGNNHIEEAYIDSGYRLLRALFSARGEASGNTVSGGGIGFAGASILTSPNIARSVEYEDRAFMRDPQIKVQYLPFASEQLVEDAGDTPITAGIESRVEFHRPSGHRRVSSSSEVAWIKEFQLAKDSPWYIRRKKDSIRVAPGSCYLLMKERVIEHHFSKEPLALPPRLQPD